MSEKKLVHLIVPPTGATQIEVGELTLPAMQTIVGGWVEEIILDDEVVMLCNEEGKHIGLPYNHRATRIVEEETKNRMVNLGSGIQGTVIFLGTCDYEGEYRTLSGLFINRHALVLMEGTTEA